MCDKRYGDEHCGMCRWAIDNDCLADEVEDCDNCDKLTCASLAKVWSEFLVICEDC